MKLTVAALGIIVLAIGFILFTPVIGLALSSNTSARVWGGTVEYTMPAGQKVVSVTWKDEDHSLWILSREMRSTEKPEEWTFQQHTNLKFLPNGKVLIHETY